MFCVQGCWCSPVVPGVPCATFPSHRAKQPGSPSPARVLLLGQVWCWQSPAWHSRAGTHHVGRAGASGGAAGCWHWQGHSVCQSRVWHQGSQGVLCQCVALPWHHLCVPCGKYGLKALPVVLEALVAVLEGSACHPAAAPLSRQQAGIGTARAAGEVPEAFSLGREPLVHALAGTSRGLRGPLPVPGHRGSPRPPPAPPSPGGERAAAGYSSSRAAHGLSQRLCVGGSDE